MNVLFVSNLTGNLYAGPNNSVPAQVRAQSKVDNVFWYNINHVKREEWSKDGLDCKNLQDYPTARLKDLPEPFNCPDIAIVEELYCYPFCKLIGDLQKKRIPYVIIPRSEMTEQAQKKRRLKKVIGNLIYFNRMIRKATAIQYLTEQECTESKGQWKKKSFVIPNGIIKKDIVKESFSKNELRATYIGRYELYQKGLDLMMEAIAQEQTCLRESGFILNMYGPDQENTVVQLNDMLDKFGIADIVKFNGSVVGAEKEKVLLATDVFIMTSRFEGHPMGLIEALSYGIPCVATLGTNISEEIQKYGAGWKAENNVESVCSSLQKMVAEKSVLSEKSKEAVRLADEFSWDKIAVQSSEMYKDIIEENE